MSVKHITSWSNPAIKKFAELKDKKGREEHGLFCVEGKRALETFLTAGKTCKQLIFTQDAYDDFSADLRDKAPVMIVTEPVIKKISAAVTPSGFAGVFELPEKAYESGRDELRELRSGIVLYEIHDPGNMGTLIRTAVAFDAACVVIGGCDPWSPKVIQASAGTLAYARIVRTDWDRLLHEVRNETSGEMRGKKLRVYALSASAHKKIEETDLSTALVVVGNEAHGLPESVERQCDDRVAISMPGPAESLNAAVAGAIALYVRSIKK